MSTTTSATVRLVVQVESTGTWGGKCDMDQVQKQAQESALGRLQQVLGKVSNVRIVRVEGVDIQVSVNAERGR